MFVTAFVGAAALMASVAAVASAKSPTVSPNVPTTGLCSVCTQYQTYTGHEDSGCYAIASAGCTIARLGTPAAIAACLAAAYGACYVPGYQECTTWAYEPCPSPTGPLN